MAVPKKFDVAIIGGGLAGLATAIRLSKSGHSVIVFEKEFFPYHKVCGEYISMESYRFLEELGLPLKSMELPFIKKLLLTAPNGKFFLTPLYKGGFGLSRFKMDKTLADEALNCGVFLMQGTKVEEAKYNGTFSVDFRSKIIGKGSVNAKVCCAAYGKRSNLDIKWKRNFLESKDKKLQNYVGIKYHIKSDWMADLIGLHNFEGGYCGISGIEDNMHCLCYMASSRQLKKFHNNIKLLEREVLCKNPYLNKIFSESTICEGFPITISQISFSKKTSVEDHVLMLGDAAGMITPLCGSGMSIALRSASIASSLIDEHLKGMLTLQKVEIKYSKLWKKNFGRRLQTGRILQSFFGSDRLSNSLISTLNILPFLAAPLIRMINGKDF